MRWPAASVVAGLVVAIGGLGWWFGGRLNLRSGEGIYADHCAACHGANLEGASNWSERLPDGRWLPPPHDATGHTWHHSDDMLFAYVKQGPQALLGADYRSDMPAFSGRLTDNEIRCVLGYIKGTWPREQREYQEMMNRPAAERLYQPGPTK